MGHAMDQRDHDVLRHLRATRASPPGLANSGSRRRTYTAAMQQFEELWEASRQIGYHSRPLPLFYAMEQLGRAIGASRLQANGGQLQGGHGLTVAGNDYARPIHNVAMAARGKGSAHAVAAAIGEKLPSAEMTIGALWSSLPEGMTDRLPGDQSPNALAVESLDPERPSTVFRMSRRAEARLHFLPERFSTLDSSDARRELTEFLSMYPTSAGWEMPPELGYRVGVGSDDDTFVRLDWMTGDQGSSGSAATRRRHLLETVGQEYRWTGFAVMRPAIAGEPAPGLFLTWWVILFGLSMFARYQPELWSKHLDVNASVAATVVETIMNDALTVIPPLALELLTGRKILEEP